MKKNLQLTQDWVEIELNQIEDQVSESGIVTSIAAAYNEPIVYGTVTRTGDGFKNNQQLKMFVNVGQVVGIGRHTGSTTEVTKGTKTYRLVRQDDIVEIEA